MDELTRLKEILNSLSPGWNLTGMVDEMKYLTKKIEEKINQRGMGSNP